MVEALLLGGVVAVVIIFGLPYLQPATPGTTAPQSSASVGPTATGNRPSPTPGSSAPGDEVMAKLWALIEDPELSYHLSGTGRSVHLGQEYERFTLELDVTGDDYAGRVNTIGGSGRARLIRKDGVMYFRPANGAWVGLESSDPTLVQVPFMAIDSRPAMAYDAPIEEGGRTVHRVISTSQYHPSITRMLDLAKFETTPDLVRLELYVSAAGVPVRAVFRCEARGVDDAGKPNFMGTADYEFSEFGAKYVIKAP